MESLGKRYALTEWGTDDENKSIVQPLVRSKGHTKWSHPPQLKPDVGIEQF